MTLASLEGGNCTKPGVDPDIFFPLPGEYEKYQAAKFMCNSCPVRLECEQVSLSRPSVDGVWAGTGYKTRQDKRLASALPEKVCENEKCGKTFTINNNRSQGQRFCCPEHANETRQQSHNEKMRRKRRYANLGY